MDPVCFFEEFRSFRIVNAQHVLLRPLSCRLVKKEDNCVYLFGKTVVPEPFKVFQDFPAET